MRSRATTLWTWRPRPMFASALTSRSTPLWRSACLTRSRRPCRSPGPRSRRRNGRHRSLPVLQRLRCRSPAPVPSTDRLISRPDPAVLGLRVAVGDPALDEPAGETAVLAFRQFAARGSCRQKPGPSLRVVDTGHVPIAAGRMGLGARWTLYPDRVFLKAKVVARRVLSG
jgi:hypothetical protein